jgi:hypothetical protein
MSLTPWSINANIDANERQYDQSGVTYDQAGLTYDGILASAISPSLSPWTPNTAPSHTSWTIVTP